MQFFCLVNGTPRNVPLSQMKFTVEGRECAIAGTWDNGKPYEPCRAQFRESLPYRWRAAFDREQFFWHDKDKPQCAINLSDRRGRYIATIYCQPVKESH